ncbi:MAG TPA: FeoB-associated Cys-rich membrane protein [Desulfobulbaceae bacterium]|nr:FeoB-associated Cys-rich membrane protein [Desulfobulbaceae bacterium]
MQLAFIFLIIALCAFFLGRRLFRGLSKPTKSGCGCGCAGCDPKLSSICQSDKKSGTSN